MMGDKDRFTCRFIGVLLVVPILLVVSCSPTPIPAPIPAPIPSGQPEPTKAGEAPVAVEPALTPPPDLQPAEEWQPYPQGVSPAGDAKLEPGYEPMRRGMAAMNDDLKTKLLDETGLKVNTARTVVLPETAVSAMPQKPNLVADTRLVQLEDMRDIFCMFRQDCERHDSMRNSDTFLLESTSGEGVTFSSWATTPGEPDTAAEGLYGYWYHIDANFFGDPAVHCVSSFSIDFGPVTPLDYDRNGTPDFGSSYLFSDWLSPAAEQKENTLTFHFDPPICARQSWDELPPSLGPFSLTSAYPPRVVETQVQDINGVTYLVKSLAPDYPLGEVLSPSQPAVSDIGQVPPVIMTVDDFWDIGCIFDQDCKIDLDYLQTYDIVNPEGVINDIYLGSFASPRAEPGTIAEGLYAYYYSIESAPLADRLGQPGILCANSFQIDFGPITPLDYDGNGTLDLVAAVQEEYFQTAVMEQKDNTLTIRFEPYLCDGWNLPRAQFLLASSHPPRDLEAQIQDTNGATYSLKSFAPDYPQQQTIVETVSIAPVAAEDPNAFDQAKLEEMFRTEGVVLGMLVLETNAPNSLIPPGAYLERAWLDGNKGVVELIDVTSGQTVYKVDLLAEKIEDPSLIIPSASIFLGSKTCLTCLWGWSICRDCFFWEFWEPEMTYEQCDQVLGSCTP